MVFWTEILRSPQAISGKNDMMMKTIPVSLSFFLKSILLSILFCHATSLPAQLKFIIEDFEGLGDGSQDLKMNGIYTYGNVKAGIESNNSQLDYLGDKYIKINKEGNLHYGGWGKGVGLHVVLNQNTDHLNFYIYQTSAHDSSTIKLEIQDDDNSSGTFEKDKDDTWVSLQKVSNQNNWQLISIPLTQFTDSNKGGDGSFNVNYKEGKLLTLHISFASSKAASYPGQNWSFDFICFSKGKLPTGTGLYDAPQASSNDFCTLGAWSQEGNSGNFTDISTHFESYFKSSSDKKLGVVHFFQPFSFDGGTTQNSNPSVERINSVIQQGYIPMITLEDHFAHAALGKIATAKGFHQPNLYSVVEGHFDPILTTWAQQIKQVKGIVLLRILHEFNGDWYPWCIANNDRDPKLFIKAYRHIHDIFKAQQAHNVKFIWCPNSMSIPQEKWNFILDAYPGNEYVDIVGMDTYNGAGKAVIWRSFRKEAIENYFILTQEFPDKPLFICEVSSRERQNSEPLTGQNKADWIMDMSKALTTDMSKIRLLTWFNEKEKFRINTSKEAEVAYSIYVWKNEYFKTGTKYIHSLFEK